jgi:hypothetical protein
MTIQNTLQFATPTILSKRQKLQTVSAKSINTSACYTPNSPTFTLHKITLKTSSKNLQACSANLHEGPIALKGATLVTKLQ